MGKQEQKQEKQQKEQEEEGGQRGGAARRRCVLLRLALAQRDVSETGSISADTHIVFILSACSRQTWQNTRGILVKLVSSFGNSSHTLVG